MDYKKIISDQKLRLKILRLFDFLPDKLMVKLQFWIHTGRKLNLASPTTYNEKVQWYKLFYRDPLMTKCMDKYAVRDYVAQKGLADILNECYGVYDKAEEIDFDSLPMKFALKVTNGSGTNIFCENKEILDKDAIINQINEWMRPLKKSPGREWGYEDIKPRIVCEKYLEVDRNIGEDLHDYKFFCFEGKPCFIQVDVERTINHRRNIYDSDWNFIDVEITYPNVDDIIERPKNFDEMLNVASILSKDFPHVRIDLYDYRGKVVFGEMTFYHGSGYEKFSSLDFEKVLGDVFLLPEKRV